MAVKITKGDVTVEIDVDDRFHAALETVLRVLREQSSSAGSPALPSPTTENSALPQQIVSADSARANPPTRAKRPPRMPAKECIALAFEQVQSLMTPEELHEYMKESNARYSPKALDPVHNIRQVLRQAQPDFKEFEPGRWQSWLWVAPEEDGFSDPFEDEDDTASSAVSTNTVTPLGHRGRWQPRSPNTFVDPFAEDAPTNSARFTPRPSNPDDAFDGFDDPFAE